MNLKNTLHTTCPSCRLSFELTAENIRQADFKRKFGKWDSVTKSNIVKALEDEGSQSECNSDPEEKTESTSNRLDDLDA